MKNYSVKNKNYCVNNEKYCVNNENYCVNKLMYCVNNFGFDIQTLGCTQLASPQGSLNFVNPYPDLCNLQGNAQETELFYYHPDHLGSTGMVTDRLSNITAGYLYAPFGEILQEHLAVDNRIPKYAFNAKEFDEENGMYYYSARYYAPPTFISRDPMFEKYPSISPYTYCANNPMKYVDPTGKTVYITGDAASETSNTLSTVNITVTRNEKTGQLSFEGKAKTVSEKLLVRAITSTKVRVNVTANNSKEIGKDENGYTMESQGGSFMGNSIIKGRPAYRSTIGGQTKEPAVAVAEQYISMDGLKENFFKKDFGAVITHEITEGYIGGLISLRTGIEAGKSRSLGKTELDPIYQEAHKNASLCPNKIPIELKNFIFNMSNLPLPFNTLKGF